MTSIVLYDTRTLGIIYSQPAYGHPANYTKRALAESARIPETEDGFLDILELEGVWHASQVTNLRLIQDEDHTLHVKVKPTLSLHINPIDQREFELFLEISGLEKNETIENVLITVDDVPYLVPINENVGLLKLKFLDEGTYHLKCFDERFRQTSPVIIEVRSSTLSQNIEYPKVLLEPDPTDSSKVVVKKSYASVVDENALLAFRVYYVTTEEIISAIKNIAGRVGLSVSFSYEKLKKSTGGDMA